MINTKKDEKYLQDVYNYITDKKLEMSLLHEKKKDNLYVIKEMVVKY